MILNGKLSTSLAAFQITVAPSGWPGIYSTGADFGRSQFAWRASTVVGAERKLMQEPRPLKTKPPRDQQPLLKVGIILSEDRKPSFRFQVPSTGYTLRGAAFQIDLPAATGFLVRASAGKLIVQDDNGRSLAAAAEKLTIQAPSMNPAPLKPQEGICLDSVVAGRNFHWRKEVQQTLPGDLEIYPSGEFLVLVNSVSFEDYITCVVTSEMAAACPKEYVKAQAVAARSWALAFLSHKHSGQPFTICNDDCCQRYQGTTYGAAQIPPAVRECLGEFLVDADGVTCAAYYSKSCGGHTENLENLFGFSAPGLCGHYDGPTTPEPDLNLTDEEQFRNWVAPDSRQRAESFCCSDLLKSSELKKYLGAVDVNRSYQIWTQRIDQAELCQNLSTKAKIPDLVEVLELIPGARGVSGRLINLRVKYRASSGQIKEHLIADAYDIRSALHESFLLSSAFVIDTERADDSRLIAVNLTGAGWGHGAGMCQIGGVAMALKGYTYKEILNHYYRDTSLLKAY